MDPYGGRLWPELERWSRFRRALLRPEREAFDSLIRHSIRYARCAAAYGERDVFDLLVMTSLLSHEERIRILEGELKTGMRLDGRLDRLGLLG
ncbi:MAG: hypothetical protein QXD32_02065 [Nitrososphaerota archaeon]